MNAKVYKVQIDGLKIVDWESFHDVFKEAFGFPDFYGRNMNAWIDCMGDIHEETSMLNITLPNDTALVLEVSNTKAIRELNGDILETLMECVAFVNWEHIKRETENAAPIHLVLYS